MSVQESATAAGRRDWVEHAEDVLRQVGHRASAPRSAVVEMLGRRDCVLSAREVVDELRGQGRDIGIATVYRAFELLDELGLVQRLDVGEGAAARYERADPSGKHHHHLVCDSCGRINAFEDARLEREIDRVARNLDYRVGGHDVILRGACPSCAVSPDGAR